MIGRVFNQALWPEAKDVDDCWVLASIQAVAAVAPWSSLPNVTAFRTAAGKPDDPNVPNGGTELDMVRGIKGVFPSIGPLTTTMTDAPWADLMTALTAGHAAALIVDSSKLPVGMRFGFLGIHAVSVTLESGLIHMANPLAPPYSWPLTISELQLKAAVLGYTGSVHAAILPTAELAFTTHPLASATILEGRRVEWDRQDKARPPRP